MLKVSKPRQRGEMSVKDAIRARRSVRDFEPTKVPRPVVRRLCWAAQGITHAASGLRASPSAGALYPMTVYVADAQGVAEYKPRTQTLHPIMTGDVRSALQAAALDQSCVGDAPLCLVFTMDVKRCARKYGEWAERYCFMEAGHMAQNVLLQATALGLGGVPVGAFHEDEVTEILQLPANREPVYLLPVGIPARV
jgi:SagB-type dehydrogenase family enzyme